MVKAYCDRFRKDSEVATVRQTFLLEFLRGCDRVLDVGCGRGELLKMIRNSGAEGVGVDFDADMIRRCREDGLNVYQEDFFSFTEKDNRFDAIVASHVIEHLSCSDAELLLSRSFERLNPGGKLIIVTPNPVSLVIMTNIFWLDLTHVRPYPLELLIEMCLDVGFEIESSGGDPMYSIPAWKNALKQKLVGPLLSMVGLGQLRRNLFSAAAIYVVGRKPVTVSPEKEPLSSRAQARGRHQTDQIDEERP